MSDFSDRPFVAGSLIGLRAFGVDKYGRLVGPSYGGVFAPGDNEAKCHSDRHLLSGLPSGTEVRHDYDAMYLTSGLSMRLPKASSYTVRLADGAERRYPSFKAIAADYPPKKNEHDVGAADCTCGFYAFFDGTNTYRQQDRVTAVVEGFGVCTVGERGFRASKARVVAFVKPEPESADEPIADKKRGLWDRVYPHWWDAALVGLNLAFAIRAAVLGEWWWNFTVSGSVALLIGILWLATATSDRSLRKAQAERARLLARYTETPTATVEWSLVERNYPGVPMYATQADALAAHPLTAPPAPCPDDEDFWTREVTP